MASGKKANRKERNARPPSVGGPAQGAQRKWISNLKFSPKQVDTSLALLEKEKLP